jgi:hypothetical protein
MRSARSLSLHVSLPPPSDEVPRWFLLRYYSLIAEHTETPHVSRFSGACMYTAVVFGLGLVKPRRATAGAGSRAVKLIPPHCTMSTELERLYNIVDLVW